MFFPLVDVGLSAITQTATQTGLYDYPSHTYNVFTEPGACDYQNTPSTWTHQPEVNPTVVDAPYSSYSQVDGSSQLYDARGVYDNVLAQPDSPVFDSSPQTWTHTTPVDPTTFDAPYNSYAVTDTGVSLADSPAGTTQLDYPGVYDNVLAEPGSPVYDSSPHVWTHTTPVDPNVMDSPYDAYAVAPGAEGAGTSKLGFIGGSGIEGGQGNADSIYGDHDDHSTYGVSGSGWQGPGNGEAPGDLWNPAVATHNAMAPTQQLATPLTLPNLQGKGALAAISEEDVCAKGGKTARASPGHVMLMGHAIIFGALSATKEVVDSGFAISWNDRFRNNSAEACEAVTPIGGYVLKTHILKN
mmetsp:Transcript_33354/g.48741  ORF Transcript_33354/g.48741 Transcript_33354/m.48741 type:complete len:355 (+) Transcript_33354:14-1078(+)